VPGRLAELADRAARRYDLTFVCGTDIPYADTWDRSGAADRAAFQRQVLQDLARHRVPYILLHGSLDERVAQVRADLEGFTKYGAPR
jgi:nicotinamide riboside kinase